MNIINQESVEQFKFGSDLGLEYPIAFVIAAFAIVIMFKLLNRREK